MFAGKARSVTNSGAPKRGFAWVGSALLTDIRLNWNGLPVTNTLAYRTHAMATK